MLKHYWMSAVDLALLVFMLLTSLKKIIGIDYGTGMLTVAKRRAAQAGIHHADFFFIIHGKIVGCASTL